MAQAIAARIIHLVSSNGFYGAERVIANLVGATGGDVHVACLCRSPDSIQPFRQDVASKGVDFRLLPFSLKSALPALKPLLDADPLVIHAHGYKEAVLAVLCWWQRRMAGKTTRLFVTQHGFTARNFKSRVYNFVSNAICRWGPVAGVVSVSPQIDAVYRRFGVRPSRLHLIANAVPPATPVDRQQARTRLAQTFQLDASLPWIGFAGRLSAEKNPGLMIRLQQALQQLQVPCTLLLAGDGPQQDLLLEQIRQNGQAADIRLLGFVGDMARFLAALDALVVPSLTEGMPMVVLEAMARGIPVLAAKVGGLPGIIDDGVNGMLVDGHDAEIYALRLQQLLQDNDVRENLQQAARQTVRDRFALEHQASAYLRLYAGVLPT